jgi:molecular chaperone DnaK
LSEEEVQRMVRDAEVNAEEDHKKRELVDARNQADAAVHSVRKSLSEYGDKLDAGEKSAIETSLKEAEDAIKSEDKADIEAKAAALLTASQKLGEKMYASQDAEPSAAGGASSGSGGAQAAGDDTVVDAEFKEVKDGKA